MNYSDAIKAIREGKKVRLPEWTGYWFKGDNDQIMAFTRTGDIKPGWNGTPAEVGVMHRTDWEEVTIGLGYDFAILALKAGKKVARAGWNGKSMWITLIKAGNAMHLGLPMLDCFGMRTADGKMCPGWLASQTDMLATDWEVAA